MGIERIRELSAELTTEIEALEVARASASEERDTATARADTLAAENQALADALKECRESAPEPQPSVGVASSVVPLANVGRVLFEDGFESGDFTRWTPLAEPGNPAWSGGGEGGRVIGPGRIVTEVAHTGTHSYRAQLDPTDPAFGKENKVGLERTDGTERVMDWFLSAWYLVPTSFPAINTLLMQAKAGGSGPSHQPVSIRMAKDRRLVFHSQILDKLLLQTGAVVPFGRWFNLTMHVIVADNGLFEAWLDGRLIGSVRTDTKDNEHAYPGVANYVAASDWPVKCHLYIDDVRVTAG